METNDQLIDLSHRELSLKSTQSATSSKDESLLRAFDGSQPVTITMAQLCGKLKFEMLKFDMC